MATALPYPRARPRIPTEILPVGPQLPATLLVLVHTEEEFDWDGPFDRRATSTAALEALDGAQAMFERAGVKPTYAMDWPVVMSEGSDQRFGAWVERGAAEIGAHLHPWVNPPHEEPVDVWHSFAGNLEPELERAKLEALTTQIERSIGVRPRTYLAGRYGLGANTPRALADLGYRVDASATPPFDFSDHGGPDFRGFPAVPYRYPGVDGLVGIPISGAYFGLLGALGERLFPSLRSPLARVARLEGLASRTGLLTRARLSPEGFELNDLMALTRALWRRGVRVFTLSLHSTSFAPGHTMYVRDAAELSRFRDRCERYLDWFRGEFGGRAMSHLDVARELSADELARADGQG